MLYSYIRHIFQSIPWTHFVIIGILSLMVTFLYRKKSSVYGSIVLGLTGFVVLFLLDASVWIRYCGLYPHETGIDISGELNRILHGRESSRVGMLCNVLVFVPIGFFLSEFLSVTRRLSTWRRLGYVTLAGFGLSLTIECLQLILRVGIFELTDLVMNTMGAFVGAGVALLARAMFVKRKKADA